MANRWIAGALLLLAGCARSTVEDRRAEEAFDRFRRPDRIIAALALRPGWSVADVGAGDGYLTGRLAQAVTPSGRVTATDVDPQALDKLRARNLPPHVFVRQVIAEEPGLEPGGYDLILLSEVDHLLPDRARYLARLRAALKPGGRIAVVNRRTYHTALLEAARRAGFSTRDVETLPAHFIVFLEAPA